LKLLRWNHKASIFNAAAILAVVALCTSVQSQPVASPRYAQYGQDPVQKVISNAIVGFAFERKCLLLETKARAEFLASLNRASIIFKSYLISMKMVQAPEEASTYVQEMIEGAIRYTASKTCEEAARQAVTAGLDSASRFSELIDAQMRSPVPR